MACGRSGVYSLWYPEEIILNKIINYSILKTEFYTPELDRIQGKGKLNKQGSESEIDGILKDTWLESLSRNYSNSTDVYDMANTFEIANEIARINLPVSTYTEWYWKIDLHNLFHFLGLRLDEHAQWETRQYANAMAEIIKEIVPLAYEAFEDYVLYAKTFSKQELEILRDAIDWISSCSDGDGGGTFMDHIDIPSTNLILNKTEKQEFLNKLEIKWQQNQKLI